MRAVVRTLPRRRKGFWSKAIPSRVVRDSAPKKRRRIENRPEQEIHIAIVAFLLKALPAGALVWHTPNSAKRSIVERAFLTRMCLVAGFPDLAILLNGRLYVGEVKAPDEDLSEAQEDTINRIVLAGGTYLGVWRSIEDAERAFRAAGVPLRAKALPGGGWISTEVRP
jgi:hypothetical protein